MKKFSLLKSFIDKKIKFGNNIKYLLEDEKGNSLYCYKCGNIANHVLICQRQNKFNVPLCRKHFVELYPEDEIFVVKNEVRNRKMKNDKVVYNKEGGENWIEVTLANGYKQAFFFDFGEEELIRVTKKMQNDGVPSRN